MRHKVGILNGNRFYFAWIHFLTSYQGNRKLNLIAKKTGTLHWPLVNHKRRHTTIQTITERNWSEAASTEVREMYHYSINDLRKHNTKNTKTTLLMDVLRIMLTSSMVPHTHPAVEAQGRSGFSILNHSQLNWTMCACPKLDSSPKYKHNCVWSVIIFGSIPLTLWPYSNPIPFWE